MTDKLIGKNELKQQQKPTIIIENELLSFPSIYLLLLVHCADLLPSHLNRCRLSVSASWCCVVTRISVGSRPKG